MQKALEKIHNHFINTHYDELVAARDRANGADTRDTTLGEGERIAIKAATGANSIDELVAQAKVIKRLKRAALIQVCNLLYYCNKHGVMICVVPAEFSFGKFNTVEGPSLFFAGGSQILERLGVISTRNFEGKAIFDYSNCIESSATWLNDA